MYAEIRLIELVFSFFIIMTLMLKNYVIIVNLNHKHR